MDRTSLPAIPYEGWTRARIHLHLLCQMIGKIRLALHPRKNHWWHCALYVSPRGLTTGPIPYRNSMFDVELDVFAEAIVIRTAEGSVVALPVATRSIAESYAALMQALRAMGIDVAIRDRPYKLAFDVAFHEDQEHADYDGAQVRRAFAVLEQVEPVLAEFSGRFLGKCSPVHLFWHSLDLAVTRFSGRVAPPLPSGAGPVDREAYSHEVISAGFWFGDETTPMPAFYAYAAPAPEGLAREPIAPRAARWITLRGAPLALLPYDDVRAAADPRATVLDFLESTYDAAARLAQWDRRALDLARAA